MVQTEQIELRTDSVEQLIEILEERPHRQAADRMPADRRQEVADRLEEQISKPSAIAFSGLPGAGKSFTGEIFADVFDSQVITMGDAIRENAPVGLPSAELGEWAAQTRSEDAETIPQWVVDIVDQKYSRPSGPDLFIIDGVRSVTDYEVLEDYFEDFYLIDVEAPFYTRLGRLQDRGREGEGAFNAVDLAERDENERQNLGYGELTDTIYIDLHITNDGTEDSLRIRISDVIENNLPFEIQNGVPLGLDADLEEQRKIQQRVNVET